MYFASPQYLWLSLIALLLVFLIITLDFIRQKNLQENKFGGDLLSRIRNYRPFRGGHYISLLLIFVSTLLFVFILASPRTTFGESYSEVKSAQVIFILDISESMNALDGDKEQQLSRLDLAKNFIQGFVGNHPGFEFALVSFAGDAEIHCPLTTDHSAFLQFLSPLNFQSIEKQGTHLNAAVTLALSRFHSQTNDHRSIILFSDGGEDQLQPMTPFTGENLSFYSFGLGSIKGLPIPVKKDISGRYRYKTFRGKTVVTSLNEIPLKNLSEHFDGIYRHIASQSQIKNIHDLLDTNIQRSSLMLSPLPGYNLEGFFIAGLLALLLVHLLFTWGVFHFFCGRFRHTRILLFFTLLSFTGCSVSPLPIYWNNSAAIRDYETGNYDDSINHLLGSLDSSPYKDIILNNLCLNYYQKLEFEKAWEYCQKSSDIHPKRFEPLYNLGNTLYRLGEDFLKDDKNRTINDWKQSIAAYKEALTIFPHDFEAQANLSFVQDKLDALLREDLKRENSNSNKDFLDSPDNQNSEDSSGSGEQLPSRGNSTEDTGMPLSEDQIKRLDEMLENLASEEQRFRKYFNPGNDTPRDFSSPFNDPLLGDFFDDSFLDSIIPHPRFDTNKKDW